MKQNRRLCFARNCHSGLTFFWDPWVKLWASLCIISCLDCCFSSAVALILNCSFWKFMQVSTYFLFPESCLWLCIILMKWCKFEIIWFKRTSFIVFKELLVFILSLKRINVILDVRLYKNTSLNFTILEQNLKVALRAYGNF